MFWQAFSCCSFDQLGVVDQLPKLQAFVQNTFSSFRDQGSDASGSLDISGPLTTPSLRMTNIDCFFSATILLLLAFFLTSNVVKQ